MSAQIATPPTLIDMFGVLAMPAGAHGAGAGVLSFLSTPLPPRAGCAWCPACCADVSAVRWQDAEACITGPRAAWRACFLGARAANVEGRADLTDADFARTWRA